MLSSPGQSSGRHNGFNPPNTGQGEGGGRVPSHQEEVRTMKLRILCAFGFSSLALLIRPGLRQPPAGGEGRLRTDLVALYTTFAPDEEGRIPEVSGVGQPLPLRLQGEGALHRIEGNPALTLQPARYVLRSEGPARKVNQALRESGEFTVEAWLEPAALNQSGPARIISLSLGTGMKQRNMTLGQEGTSYCIRLRLSRLEGIGDEAGAAEEKFEVVEVGTPTGVLLQERHHVAVTYATCPHCGVATLRVSINGEPVLEHWAPGGDFRDWDTELPLLVGNEATLDRPWFGAVSLVAFYRRALLPEEIRQNFKAGL